MNCILLIGALLGFTSIGVGAYIDHVMVHVVDIKTLSIMKTALHYHEMYAMIIFVIGFQYQLRNDMIFLKLSAWVFIIGIILFCFSIYLKALTGEIVWIKLTPIGGILLMVAWLLLACSSFKYIKRGESIQ